MRGWMSWGAAVMAVALVCAAAVPAVAGEAVDWGAVFEKARQRHKDFDWSRFDSRRDSEQAGREQAAPDKVAPSGTAGADDAGAPKAVEAAAEPTAPQPESPRAAGPAPVPAPAAAPAARPSMSPLPVIPVPNPPRAPEPAPAPEKRYRIDFPGVEARKPAREAEPETVPDASSEAAPASEPPAPLLTPEEQAKAAAEALAEPERSVDTKTLDPAAWREATKPPAPEPMPGPTPAPEVAPAAEPEPAAAPAPLLTPEQRAKAEAEALAEPRRDVDVAAFKPTAWRDAVTPKPVYGPVEVTHFLDLALYDAAAQTAHLEGGPTARSLVLVRRKGEVRLRVLGAVPPAELARVQDVLRDLAPELSRLTGLPVHLVPATDKTANANVFVMAASPGDALEGYTRLTTDDGQAVTRSDTVLYRGASDAAVRREALRAMGLTGRETGDAESVMRPRPADSGGGLPALDATALAMLYRPELRAGMDYDEARAALEALKR